MGTPAAAAAAKAAAIKVNRLAELAGVVQTRVTAFYGGNAVSSVRARADLLEMRALIGALRQDLLADRKTLQAERKAARDAAAALEDGR